MQSKEDREVLQLPLLEALLNAEAQERESVAGSRLAELADHLLAIANQLPGCVVWPVGRAAERVVGAATVRSGAIVEFGAWGSPVADRDVLLVEVAGVSALSMAVVARDLRKNGAAAIHACAVDVVGAEACGEFDSFTRLGAPSGVSAPSELRAA